MSNNEENVGLKNKDEKIRENVLDWFRKIGKDNEQLIVKNGAKLLTHLIENKDSENGKDELKYALNRLIRGLGGSSNSIKQGYYTVLIGLLNCFDDVSVFDVLEVGSKELHTSAGNSKSENADILAGQILLYGAIIRTGLFDKADKDQQKSIVENLVNAGKKRNYLFLLASTFINQLCNNVNENYFKLNIFPILSPELKKPWPEQTVDTLYLLYVLNDRFPNVVNKKLIKSILGSEEIVSAKNLNDLSNVLINMPRLETANHPIYDLLSKNLAQKRFVVDFIKESDKLLIKYNHNRHMVFTLILTTILTNLNESNLSLIPDLITKNYIQQTLIYFKTIKNYNNNKKQSHLSQPEQLQQKIYELFNKIVEILKSNKINPEIKINVLKKFLFDPGTFIFEKLTKTKIVQQIINDFDRNGVHLTADLFKSVILSKENDKNKRFLNNDRVYAAQLLVKLLNHDKIKDDYEWKINQMIFLLKLAFVNNIKDDDNEGNCKIGNELTKSVKQSFYKCLTLKQESFRFVRINLSKLAKVLNDYFNKNEVKCNEDVEKCWKKAYGLFKMVDNLEKNVKNQNNVDEIRLNHIYQTMFLYLGFHSFQDTKLTEESLNELESCFKRKNLNDFKGNEGEEEPHFTEVLIDLFLCLLSYNSLLFRNLIKMVFPHFADYLTDEAFLQILYVLNPDNKRILSGKLRNEEESEEGESSSSEDEDENNDLDLKDELKPDLNSESDSESDSESNSESNSDSEIESDLNEKQNQQNERLKESLQSVLGEFGVEEMDLDKMSESEGQKLDEALSLAFKQNNVQRKPKKQRKQSHKDQLKMNFRIRVLDLVDLYLDNEPSLLICIETLPTLLKLEEFTIIDPFQKQLLDRVKKTIRKLGSLKKFNKNVKGNVFYNDVVKPSENDEFKSKLNQFLLMFLNILDKNDKNIYLVHALKESVSNSLLFLIHSSQFLLINFPKTEIISFVREIIKIALDSYFLNRDSIVNFDLFKKTIFRMNFFGLYDLIENILVFIYLEELKLFKKTQAVQLAKEFFKNHRFLTLNPIGKEGNLSFKIALNDFISTTEAVFEYSIQNNTRLQEKFVQILVDLLTEIVSSPISYLNPLKIRKLIDLFDKYKKNSNLILNNKTKNVFDKFLKLSREKLERLENIEENDNKLTENHNVSNKIVKIKKSKKILKKRIDEIKEQLNLNCNLGAKECFKRKVDEIIDDEIIDHNSPKKLKLNKNLNKDSRRSLKIEMKQSPEFNKQFKAKRRQSTVF